MILSGNDIIVAPPALLFILTVLVLASTYEYVEILQYIKRTATGFVGLRLM